MEDQFLNHLFTCHIICPLSIVMSPLAVRAHRPQSGWCLVDLALPVVGNWNFGEPCPSDSLGTGHTPKQPRDTTKVRPVSQEWSEGSCRLNMVNPEISNPFPHRHIAHTKRCIILCIIYYVALTERHSNVELSNRAHIYPFCLMLGVFCFDSSSRFPFSFSCNLCVESAAFYICERLPFRIPVPKKTSCDYLSASSPSVQYTKSVEEVSDGAFASPVFRN